MKKLYVTACACSKIQVNCMKVNSKFIALSFISALLTKILGELVHEVFGHGTFVLLFGGRIIAVNLSLTWPLQLSSIAYDGKFEAWQLAWIDGGGILICIIVSFLLQAFLLLKIVKDWRLASLLFWLSFWTFLNPIGYLVIGGIKPFGDIVDLIARGVLTREISLALGVLIFAVAFFSISKAWVDLSLKARIDQSIKGLRVALFLVWFIVPMVTVGYCLGARQSWISGLTFVALSLIPSLVSTIIPSILPRYFGETAKN